MPWIGDARVVQPENYIADPVPTLRRIPESDPPTAIDAIVGTIVTLPNVISRPVDPQRANRSGDMRHIIPPNQAVCIANSRGMHIIRGEQ
jgi:hypothetical protein